MKKLLLLACAAGFLLIGCATKPVSNEEAKPVPSSQIINTSLLDKKEGTGQVIIKRDSGFFGSACFSRVYVDGKEVADLGTSQKVTVYPTIGDHIFSAWPKGICGGGMSGQAGEVVEDKTLIYRIGYGSNGEYGIQPTAF